MTEEAENLIRLVPPITPELLAENAEFQKQIREGLNARDVDPVIANRARQLLRAEEIKAIISEIKRNSALNNSTIENQIAELSEKLATAFFEAAEYELAAAATRNERRQQLYAAHVEAVERDDGAHCEHQKYKLIDGVKQANYFREKDIFTSRHGRIVSVIKCNECDFRNIKSLPDDLAEASRIRAEFRRANT